MRLRDVPRKLLSALTFQRSTSPWRLALSGMAKEMRREVGDGADSSVLAVTLLWIARVFPEALPALWREQRDGRQERIGQHDMLELLRQPNRHYSGVALMMATVTDLVTTGNAYWIKIRNVNGTGPPVELWWAPSGTMEPKGNESEFIDHYAYAPNGIPIRIEREDVVHLRYGLDPDNYRKGRSPLYGVLREVYTDQEAAKFTAALLRNHGVPGLILGPKDWPRTGQGPSAEDVEATKRKLTAQTTGERRGEPLVMSGPFELQQFGFSPDDMNLRELRRIPEERVSGALGVPAIVAGLGAGLDRSTFANMGEAREMAYEACIMPLQRLMGEDLRMQLLPDFEGEVRGFRVGFDTSSVRVLQEDRDRVAARADVGVRGGWLLVNEARVATGFEEVEGGDIYLRPISALEVPRGMTSTDVLDASIGGRDPPKVDMPEGVETKTSRRTLLRLVVSLERMERRQAVAMADALEADFAQLGELAARAFRRHRDMVDLAKSADAERTKASDLAAVAAIMQSMRIGEWSDSTLRTTFELSYARTLDATVDTINGLLDLSVSIPDHVARAIIHQGGTRRGLVDLTVSTRDAILRAIAQGRADGLGPMAVARLIRDEVPAGRFSNAGPAYRAQLIARTETKFAQNLSSIAAYRESDNVTAVMAFDARLGETDADCELRDGQVMTFEAAELAMAEEHPNGTLSFAPVVG